MSKEVKRTYKSFREWASPSKQTEYTAPTPLLGEDGTLLVKGWARRNVFAYDRDHAKPVIHCKEWDFYQISNGKYMVQVSFANISFGGYASATLVDLETGKVLAQPTAVFLGGRDKYILPAKGDVPHSYAFNVGKATFAVDAAEHTRTVDFEMKDVVCHLEMDTLPGHENITTVLPFEDKPTCYFMTTKQNCMPTAGYYKWGSQTVTFDKADTFCVLDWGRVNTPYRLVWYWGNGSAYIYDDEGNRHLFGFEITWGIGDESNATETCMFLDGKAYKFDAVDVKTFPKPDKYMQPWVIESADGKFNLTMTPTLDHHSDLNALIVRMHSHQVHGKWNGDVTIDGKTYHIKDMYAFCEYVENRW
jgi:hypothetical protein